MAFDVMSVFVKIGADTEGLESGLSKAKGMVSGLGNVVGAGMKAVGTAIAGATAAVGALGAAALSSYSNYEQLVGGVDKLYGTASGKLQEYADKAFLTAGMSANSYMETATSFSAALINSLGGDVDAAADMTDVAMRAMSDNVNVFGSDFGSVQNAFQGFAKQNYTMLDNLKLGYGGTKSEMERLIDDANEYRASIGETADLSIDSFADVVQAIQSVQEAQHIAGTTNKEAMKTIEGSATATKAAWQNVVTAIGRGEGLSDALNGLTTAIFGTDSSTGLLNQVIPRIQTVMEGIGDFVGTAAPFITEKIPELVSSVVPSMLSAGVELLGALGEGFMDSIDTILFTIGDIAEMVMDAFLEGSKNSGAILDVIDWILGVFNENYADLINVGMEIITNIINGITEGIPNVAITITDFIHNVVSRIGQSLPAIMTAVVKLVGAVAKALIDNAPILLDAAIQLLQGLVDGIIASLPVLIEMIPTLVQSVVDAIIAAIPILIDGAIQLVTGIVQALPTIITALIEAIPQIVTAIVNGLVTALPLLIQGAIQLTLALVQALPQIMKALYDALPMIIQTVANAIITNVPVLINGLVQMVAMLAANLPTIAMAIIKTIPAIFKAAFNAIITATPMILQAIVSILTSIGQSLASYGAQFISFVVQTLNQLLTDVGNGMRDMFNTVVNWLSQLPAKMAYYAGYAIGSFMKFVLELPGKVQEVFNNVITKLVTFATNFINKAKETAKNFLDSVVNGIKELPNNVKTTLDNVITNVTNFATDFITKATNAAKDFLDKIVDGIKNLPDNVKTTLDSVITNVGTFVTNFVDKAKSAASDFLKGINDGIGTLPSDVKGTLDSVITNAGTFVTDFVGKAKSAASDFVSNITGNGMSDLPSTFQTIGSNIVNGIWTGISSGWDWLTEKVGNLAQSLFNAAKTKLGIRSPSKKFAWIGQMVDEGFAKGLTDYAHLIDNAMDDVIRVPDVNGAFGDALTGGSQGNAGYTQVLNITSPEALSPYEIARQTRNATRDMVLAMSV